MRGCSPRRGWIRVGLGQDCVTSSCMIRIVSIQMSDDLVRQKWGDRLSRLYIRTGFRLKDSAVRAFADQGLFFIAGIVMKAD